MNKLIFVSGTGRSGTHLIGRSISSHPEIQGRIENPTTFKLITKIATHQDINPLLTGVLKKWLYYKLRAILKKSNTNILEKSHTSLWLMEDLINKFKNSYFICVYRDVKPTVSSMLEHKGVLSWYSKLPQHKKNRFLGINSTNLTTFKDLSLEEKCTLRWLSHKNEIKRLKEKYPERVLEVKYSDYITSTATQHSRISKFLGITNAFSPEKFKISSLDKWKEKLSNKQLILIDNTLAKAKNNVI